MAAQRVVVWFGVVAVFVLLGGLLWMVYDGMLQGEDDGDPGVPHRPVAEQEPEKAPEPRVEEGPVNPFPRPTGPAPRAKRDRPLQPKRAPARSASHEPPIVSFGVLNDYLLSTRNPTIYGVVTDENGPVKGAYVALYREYPAPLDYPRVGYVRSDERGQFVFPPTRLLPNTHYHLHVRPPGKSSKKASRFFWRLMRGKKIEVRLVDGQPLTGRVVDSENKPVPAATVVAQGQTWREGLRADKDGVFNFAAAPAGESIKVTGSAFSYEPASVENASAGGGEIEIRLTPGVPVSGKVVDGITGEPLGGVAISMGMPGLPERIPLTQTDEEGKYEIPGLPAAFTTFYVTLEGYSEVMHNTKIVKQPAMTFDFKMFTEGKVSGRVVDASGAPVAGARIFIALKNVFVYYVPDPSRPAAISDEDGTFEVSGISTNPNADCKLAADHPDYLRGESGVMMPKPGQRIEGVVIKVAGGLGFEGMVKSKEGRPIDGAEVKVTAFSNQVIGTVLFGAALANAPSTKTDEEGKFVFRRLTAGRARVDVSAPAFIAVQEMVEIPKEGLKGKIFTMEPGYSIEGRVLDMAGNGIPAARVHAASPHPINSYSNALTNQEGYFKVENLKQGAFTITVRATGFADASREGVQVGEKKVDFSLIANGKVTGRVTSAVTGAPVKDYVVNLMSRRPNGTYQWYRDFRHTTEDGRYACQDVEPGTYKVTIRAADHAMQYREGVSVSSGNESGGVDFVLTAGASIMGKVTDVRGMPIKDAHVVASPIDHNGRPSAEGQTLTGGVKADGTYRIRGLMLGTYEVKPSAGGYCQSRGRRLRIVGEQAYQVDLMLHKGGHLRVRVTDKDGKAVPGAQIRIVDASGAVYGGTQGAGGDAVAGAAGDLHGMPPDQGGVPPEERGMTPEEHGGVADGSQRPDWGLQTGQGGNFRLPHPIAPGPATVVVTATGFRKKQAGVTVQDEGEVGVRIVLRRNKK